MTKRFVLSLACACLFASAQGQDASQIDFQKDIAPILRQNCVDCHGPDLQMAELRLDQRRFVFGDDANPDLMKPGKSSESLLVHRLTDRKLGILMPPTFPFFPNEQVGLATKQIALIKAWIDQGATWPEGVSLSADAKLDQANSAATALTAAIRAGDLDGVRSIVAGSKEVVNARDRRGSTPLMQAGMHGEAKILKYLLDCGAEVNATNDDGATALMRAAGDYDKVKLLVERGAKVDAKSALGRTPLLIAANYPGNTKTVKLLLERGANIQDIDPFGDTCLTAASKRGDVEMVRALIAAGADLSAGGRPPLAWAAEEGNFETVECLLEHGAGKVKQHVSLALSAAAARGPHEAVKLLLEHGGDPNSPMSFGGYTPLMLATYSENLDPATVRLLLEKGANAAAAGAGGETPLSLAAKHGLHPIVALVRSALKEKKSDPPLVIASASLPAMDATPERIRQAAQTSLALLQKCGPIFFQQSGCVSCHQQSVTSLAVAAARTRGLEIDEQIAREQRVLPIMTGRTYLARWLERGEHPAGSAPSIGYVALGLAADGVPADEVTDGFLFEMSGRQNLDGSWTAFGHRPPLEYSRFNATALGLRALQLYAPPSLKAAYERRVERAREWLIANKPTAANTDHVFRLLGLAWSGGAENQRAAEVKHLLETQRADGGWAQHDDLASDAYATGLTLYALRVGGDIRPQHAAYQRAVKYLLATQREDGSWLVKTRAFPFQPYFESGFPHGPDQWISAAATGWATTALIEALPPK